MFNQLSNIVLLELVQDESKVRKTCGQNHFMFLISVLGGGVFPPHE